jgi:hypothetical protein
VLTPLRTALAGAAIAVLTLSCSPIPGDDLDPVLRAEVEQLKLAAEQEITSSANLADRLDVLWRWANAYALSGRPLPVNLPRDVGYLGISVTDGTEPDPAQLAEIDGYIRELAVHDAQPTAIGSLRFASTEPLPAGSWQTLEQTYTVGSMAIEPGGAIVVAKQLATDQGRLQHEDPAGDNYLSITSSSPYARFERVHVPLSGMHGGWRVAAPMPAFRLEGAPLEPGDTVTVTYGDRSGGSRGFQTQTFATDRLLLPIYIDPTGDGTLFTLAWPGLEVIGTDIDGVRVTAPSIVTPGEPFELAVRSEDRFCSRAAAPIPGYQVLRNGDPVARIEAGSQAVTVLSDLTIDQPGVYRFTVRSEDGSIEGTSNPVWVREDPPHRIYWGETHGHGDFAEGQGSADGYFRYGRDDARLDFLTLSEHDIWMDDLEWRTLQELTRRYTREGRMAAFLGYEWTVPFARGGHHNVLFRNPDRQRVGFQRANRLPDLYRGLNAENRPEDVLVIPHAHEPGDWTQSDPELERLVEIYSMHGTFEWFGNMYLQNGFEVGFVGGADEHRSKPGFGPGVPMPPLAQISGLAGVLAPAKTVDAIFDSLRGLRAYATSGQRIILDADLNGAAMGTRQGDAEERQIDCRVMGTAPIDQVDVIKNGEVVFSRHYLSAPVTERSWLLVGFESSSEVPGEARTNPRGYRIWEGVLEIEGATVAGFSTPGFDNLYLERAEVDPDDSDVIRFRTETRGRRDTLLLELEGASAATVLRIRLAPTRENFGALPPTGRGPTEIGGADLRLPFADLVDGRLERVLEVGPHTDRVTLQVVDPEGPTDVDFSFTDLVDPRPGDYYYVRVTQLDGARAWSSPWWVGER